MISGAWRLALWQRLLHLLHGGATHSLRCGVMLRPADTPVLQAAIVG